MSNRLEHLTSSDGPQYGLRRRNGRAAFDSQVQQQRFTRDLITHPHDIYNPELSKNGNQNKNQTNTRLQLTPEELNEGIRMYIGLTKKQRKHRWARAFRKQYGKEIDLYREFEIATKKPI
ncbi:MAG TPA: hypothetical protein VHE53_01640 [Patescibacteria group bacterium]|nr:hypothetical protein [Patescibacteria group bacterium]